MIQKILIMLAVVGALATAEKITIGNRRQNDTLLVVFKRSSVSTDNPTKHELLFDEKNIDVTYAEFNIYPVSK